LMSSEFRTNKTHASSFYRSRHLSDADIYQHNQSPNFQQIMVSIGI